MKRLKVLISAHELSPFQGSECSEGWNLVTRIARHHDVTVLYARGSQFSPKAYETAIKKYYTDHINEFNIQYIPVAQPRLTLWLAGLNRKVSGHHSSIGLPFLYFIGYRLWQKKAFRIASDLVDNNDFASLPKPFSIVHHLTQITFREPGYLWRLPLPFIWGPTGGISAIPVSYYRHIGFRAAVFEAFRTITNWLTLNFNQRIRSAIKRSSLVYAFSAEDQLVFRKEGVKRVELMLDAGCELPVVADELMGTGSGPQGSGSGLPVAGCSRLKVLWCGQLIRRKALDILLKAVSGDESLISRIEITVVGDGPLRDKYERLALELQLTQDNRQSAGGNPPTVTFTGWLAREEVFACMKRSDVLVHTSYREATSNVIPEALSFGLPVICHDIGGMSIAITSECGIKIPLVSYNQSIAGFRQALTLMTSNHHPPTSNRQPTTANPQPPTDTRQPTIDNRQQTTSYHSAAIRRAQELSWDTMAERISNSYLEVL